MDKRKVIHAYLRGYINLQECAQILGIDSEQIMGMMSETQRLQAARATKQKQRSANG